MADPKLNVKISADNKELNKGLKNSQRQVGRFEGVVKKAGLALVGAFAAKQIFSGIKNLVNGLANAADRLLDLEQITGITTGTLQEYEYVAKIAGVNTEALANASMGLTQRLARATTESSPLNIALKQLGVNAKDASGALRGGEAIMEDVIDQLAKMENVTERNVIGSQIFAGAWKDMAPILSMGADGIEQVRKEAREMGLVMDKEALQKANEFRIAKERLSATASVLGRELGMMLIPTLNTLADGFTDVLTQVNNLRAGFNAIKKDDTLSWWEKAWTKTQSILGHAIGSAAMIHKANAKMAESQRKYNEALSERVTIEDQMSDLEDSYAVINNHIEDGVNKTGEQVEKIGEVKSALGEIAQIEKDIADAKMKYLNATSAIERAAHVSRMRQLQKEREKYEEVAERLATLIGAGDIGGPESVKSIGPAGSSGLGVGTGIDFSDVTPQFKEITDVVHEAEQAMIDWQQTGTQAAASLAMGLMQMSKDGRQSIGELIKATLSQVVSSLIAQIISSVPFPANIPLAMGAGVMAGTLMNQVPAFADGAMVKSPTMAMFGEYAGARSNPEFALRQDQLEGVIRKAGTNVSGEFKIRGQDLVATYNEAQRRGRVY